MHALQWRLKFGKIYLKCLAVKTEVKTPVVPVQNTGSWHYRQLKLEMMMQKT